jgi:senataxin
MFPSRNFYKNRLTTGEKTLEKVKIDKLDPYLIYDLSFSKEEGEENTGGIYNSGEAQFVLKKCIEIKKSYKNLSIGIITPYQRQVAFLKDLFRNEKIYNDIEISTVDSYQGREKDIIIFSSVRAQNFEGKIGFLGNSHRLNVSLTRAKSALYIVCHAKSLRNGSDDWRNCIDDAHKRNLIRNIR